MKVFIPIIVSLFALSCADNNAKSYESVPNPVNVTATQYYKDYQENEIAADDKYKGKPIFLKGTVQSISKDISDNGYLMLGPAEGKEYTDDFESWVKVELKDAAQAKTLHRGQQVTIEGTGNGMMVGIPIINDGEIRQAL
jgi:hypothetical protein